jgi:hypothetical protein
LHQHIAAIKIITLAADIAKFAKTIKRSADRWFRNTQSLRKTANGMRRIAHVNRKHQGHLPRGQIRRIAANAGDQGMTP